MLSTVIARSIATFRDAGEACGKHRVAKLMKQEGIAAANGLSTPQGHYGGKSVRPQVAPNTLAAVSLRCQPPTSTWVTDITYIRTHEGWLYLAVVLTCSLARSSAGDEVTHDGRLGG